MPKGVDRILLWFWSRQQDFRNKLLYRNVFGNTIPTNRPIYD